MRYAVISRMLTISQLEDAVRKCGGRNLKIAPASKQIFCELDDTALTRLRVIGCIINKIGGVKVVTVTSPIDVAPPVPVAAAPVYTAEDLAWAIGLEELRSISVPPLYGEGFTLAIIDSGIRETHQKINGRVIYSKNYTSSPMRDGLDHGTGVCNIALVMAPLCNILNLKVLDDEGVGTEEEVALAIDDCISLLNTNPAIAPSVINLSLGSPDDGNPDNPMRVACRAAIDAGIWVLASAGNDGPVPYSITCPACEQYVLAIGSCSYEPFEISSWSSRGPTKEGLTKPDAVMFGEDIVMASAKSDTATTAKSGTSFSTPFCSGMSVLYYEGILKWGGVSYPGEVPMGFYPEVTEFISVENLSDIYLIGICIKPEGAPEEKDYDYGYGLVFGPLVYRAITIRPLDVSAMLESIMPIFGIALLGMIMVPMIKGVR